jgi:hypothetical protein
MAGMLPRLLASALVLTCVAAQARLTKFDIDKRDTAAGYETLSGHFTGELDPKDAHNSIITDIEKAPKNAHGMVEYTATFALVKPLDMARASGVLFYSVPNRGNGAPTVEPDGHVSVVSGWQADVKPRPGIQSITVPAVPGVTGPVSERFINIPNGTNTVDFTAAPYVALAYQKPATLDTAKASLTKRSGSGTALPVASTAWAFADCTKTPFPGTPDPSRICAKDGFDPEAEYVLVFTAKDPLVLGIGYAATRDLNSFLRYAEKDEAGTANPVAGKIRWALSRGNSQSGNFIRSYIHLGFNQDEAKRIVWDGVNPHIAARQLVLNLRFANPGGAAGVNEPGSEAVVWWNEYADKVRRRPTAGLLTRCKATNTCPKVVETFGALEFWYLRESPNLVGTDAKADIPLPPNVRRYFMPGTGHGGGRGGFTTKAAAPPNGCVLPANPNPESDTMRALTKALVEWVTNGTEPPPSRYPRLDRNELAVPTSAAIGFRPIPGYPTPDGLINPVLDHDFGAEVNYNDISGVVTKQPPTVKRVITTLVPKVNEDGSDVGGVPSVLREAPLGSYLGWNPTATGFDKGKQCTLSGGFIPFATTKAERTKNGDHRLSLEERYTDHAGYVATVKAAAEKAVRERFLLDEDAKRLVLEADASDVLAKR